MAVVGPTERQGTGPPFLPSDERNGTDKKRREEKIKAEVAPAGPRWLARFFLSCSWPLREARKGDPERLPKGAGTECSGGREVGKIG